MMIKVYCDSGADITCLKNLSEYCLFYQFPYDSADRPKKLIRKGVLLLAQPSAAYWEDCNQTWKESNFTWEEASGSDKYTAFQCLLENGSKKTGNELRRDVLHLDSAYKTGCHIFITSDNLDIASKKTEIENLCGIKVFRSHIESEELVAYIRSVIG